MNFKDELKEVALPLLAAIALIAAIIFATN